METFRVLYLTFVILYLITLAIGLWFLLYYSGVPGWVWIFFAIAIILLIISTMMRETREQNKKNFDRWGIFFVVLDVISIILMIVGFIFVVMYSTLPWWIWLILGLSILFLLIVGILRAANINIAIVGLILGLLGVIGLFTGIILILIYSKSPWWVWMIFVVVLVFDILANIFVAASAKGDIQETQHNPRPGDFCVKTDKSFRCSLGKENKNLEVDKSDDPNYWCMSTDQGVTCYLGKDGNYIKFPFKDINSLSDKNETTI